MTHKLIELIKWETLLTTSSFFTGFLSYQSQIQCQYGLRQEPWQFEKRRKVWREGRFDSVSKSSPIQLLEDHCFQSIINQNSQFEFTINVAFGLNRSLTDKLSCQEYDWSPSGTIGEHSACCRGHQELASQFRWHTLNWCR